MRTVLLLAGSIAAACASPAGAQLARAPESHRTISSELGLFTYDRDRYPGDQEIGAHGSIGYRIQRAGLFVEPHLRAMVRLGGDEPPGCDACDTPLAWPGVTGGIVFGGDYFSHALALRLAAGVDDGLSPLAGLRYEGSARWFAWYVEGAIERVGLSFDDGSGAWHDEASWSPTLLVGARMALRETDAAAPGGLDDSGVLPTGYDQPHDTTIGRRRHQRRPPIDDDVRAAPADPEPYLVLWAEDEDRVESPFVAVLDVDAESATYRDVIATLAVGDSGATAHHVELPGPSNGMLWANSFSADETFLLDFARPARPAVAARLARAHDLTHPHTIVPLSKGNVLVTYQLNGDGTGPGGIALHDGDGEFLRGGSALDPDSHEFVRPYGALVLPDLDRVLTTGTDMHGTDVSRVIQLWRLSDLRLLATETLPPGPLGTENAHSFEPRMLPDGTVFVVTLGCGLYRVDGIEHDAPAATLEHTFDDTRCFMPATSGFWWIQTLARENAIQVLDLTDPRVPRIASRLQLPADHVPHWLATDAAGTRLVLTGYAAMKRRVVLLHFDRRTGALTIDPTFTDGGGPGIALDGPDWPHGATGPAVPHGAVFLP